MTGINKIVLFVHKIFPLYRYSLNSQKKFCASHSLNHVQIRPYLCLKKQDFLSRISPFHVILSSLCIVLSIFLAKNYTLGSSIQPSGDSLLTELIITKEIECTPIHKTIKTKSELHTIANLKSLGFAFYCLQPGENLSSVANKFGLSMSTILSLNSLDNANSVSLGQKILVSTLSGIMYSTTKEETVEQIAIKHKISSEKILSVNELKSAEISAGTTLFLPGANLSLTEMTKLLGYTFINPVPGYRRLSSHFGWRSHPTLRQKKLHAGIDLAAPSGTKIRAAREGRIIFCGMRGGAGLTTAIRHNNGLSTVYAHQAQIIVKAGDWVKTGQHIGFVGTTGVSTGPHLHFEIRKYGQAKNPLHNGLKLR